MLPSLASAVNLLVTIFYVASLSPSFLAADYFGQTGSISPTMNQIQAFLPPL